MCKCIAVCVCMFVCVCLLRTEIGFSVCSVATRHRRHPASLQPLLPGRVSSLTTSTFDFVVGLLLLLAKSSWWIARKNIKPIFSAYKWGRVRIPFAGCTSARRPRICLCLPQLVVWQWAAAATTTTYLAPKIMANIRKPHTPNAHTRTANNPSRQHCGHNGPHRTHTDTYTRVLPMCVSVFAPPVTITTG